MKEVHDLYVSLGYDDLADPDEGTRKAQMFRALLKGEAQSKWNQFYTEVTDQLAPAAEDEFEPMAAYTGTLTRWLSEHLTDEEIGRTIRSDINTANLKYPHGWTTSQVETRLRELNKYISYAPGNAEVLSDMDLINIFERMIPESWLKQLKKKDGYIDMSFSDRVKYIKTLEKTEGPVSYSRPKPRAGTKSRPQPGHQSQTQTKPRPKPNPRSDRGSNSNKGRPKHGPFSGTYCPTHRSTDHDGTTCPDHQAYLKSKGKAQGQAHAMTLQKATGGSKKQAHLATQDSDSSSDESHDFCYFIDGATAGESKEESEPNSSDTLGLTVTSMSRPRTKGLGKSWASICEEESMTGQEGNDDDGIELPKYIFLGPDNSEEAGYESDPSHELYFGELLDDDNDDDTHGSMPELVPREDLSSSDDSSDASLERRYYDLVIARPEQEALAASYQVSFDDNVAGVDHNLAQPMAPMDDDDDADDGMMAEDEWESDAYMISDEEPDDEDDEEDEPIPCTTWKDEIEWGLVSVKTLHRDSSSDVFPAHGPTPTSMEERWLAYSLWLKRQHLFFHKGMTGWLHSRNYSLGRILSDWQFWHEARTDPS